MNTWKIAGKGVERMAVGFSKLVAMTGYSGTPLIKKLGIKENFKIRIIHPPANYFDLLADLPANTRNVKDTTIKKNFIHYFPKDGKELYAMLPKLKGEIKPDGMIWVSWPKKSSKIPSDITEDFIRNYAIKTGLVDIKVCAVDEIWSGLKLVIPVKDR
jgi:hypothetical protein